MFTGKTIDELMDMVARAEDHAHASQFAGELDDMALQSSFVYQAAEAQPELAGVA